MGSHSPADVTSVY